MNTLLRQTKLTAIACALLFATPILMGQANNAAPAAKPAQSAKAAQQVPPPPPLQSAKAAQQAQPAKAPQEQAPPPPSLERVTAKIFTIKHRNPGELVPILKGFLSHPTIASIDSNTMGDLKLLTVRDYPANIALIEKALEMLDVPEAKAQAFELTINLLWGSKKDFKGDPVPSSLSGVVDSISKAMNYSHFREAGVIIQTTVASGEPLIGLGTLAPITLGSSPIPMNWSIQKARIDASGVLSAEFSITAYQPSIRNALFSLKEGDKLVIGTAMYGEYALVVVLSMKMINGANMY
jgi:hypothetical protein